MLTAFLDKAGTLDCGGVSKTSRLLPAQPGADRLAILDRGIRRFAHQLANDTDADLPPDRFT